MTEFERITFNQKVMGGNGLEPDDIRQALRFAAWLAAETVHPIELAS